MPKPKLPHTLFIKMESDTDGPYPLAYGVVEDAVDESGTTEVGTYRLVATRKLRKIVTEEVKEQK